MFCQASALKTARALSASAHPLEGRKCNLDTKVSTARFQFKNRRRRKADIIRIVNLTGLKAKADRKKPKQHGLPQHATHTVDNNTPIYAGNVFANPVDDNSRENSTAQHSRCRKIRRCFKFTARTEIRATIVFRTFVMRMLMMCWPPCEDAFQPHAK